MPNSTFMGSEPTWANACVGENGFINYFTYAEGYSKAANLILDHVLKNYGNDIDSFIYPICFNMRHSIELRLKGAITELTQLSQIKHDKLPLFDLVGSHDIGNLWAYFKKNSEVLDIRFHLLNNLLDPTIMDINKIDPNGQTFRYPFDINSKKHLIEQSVISCLILKLKFEELENNLNELKYLNELLIEEYKLGTFVKKFSRSQIFNLVKKLPLYQNWRTDLNKLEICANNDLSSNDLTKILNFIKENHEISSILGIKKDLIYLKDDQILDLCEIWCNTYYSDFKGSYQINEEHQNRKSDIFEQIKEYSERHHLTFKKLDGIINLDLVADIWSLFYLSRDNCKYSEYYTIFYTNYKQDINQQTSLIDSFDHVFSKPNFLENIIKSLFFLQQINLVEKIIIQHDLETYFKFILDARSRELFKKSELLQYEI